MSVEINPKILFIAYCFWCLGATFIFGSILPSAFFEKVVTRTVRSMLILLLQSFQFPLIGSDSGFLLIKKFMIHGLQNSYRMLRRMPGLFFPLCKSLKNSLKMILIFICYFTKCLNSYPKHQFSSKIQPGT